MPRQPLLFPRRRLVPRVPDVANFYGVTERTVWNWILKGAVEVERTPGGGVRIIDAKVVEALKSAEEA
jgi:predicted site-specific integrase-resolvase